MRKKAYHKNFIIRGACEVVEKKGFDCLTARAVAKELSISTQPIYLEFKNMEMLKKSTIERMLNLIKESYFLEVKDLTSFFHGYYDFYDKNVELFRAIQSDKEADSKLNKFFYKLFDSFNGTDNAFDRSLSELKFIIVIGTISKLDCIDSSHKDKMEIYSYFRNVGILK